MGHGLQCLTPVCIACGPQALEGVGCPWLCNKENFVTNGMALSTRGIDLTHYHTPYEFQ